MLEENNDRIAVSTCSQTPPTNAPPCLHVLSPGPIASICAFPTQKCARNGGGSQPLLLTGQSRATCCAKRAPELTSRKKQYKILSLRIVCARHHINNCLRSFPGISTKCCLNVQRYTGNSMERRSKPYKSACFHTNPWQRTIAGSQKFSDLVFYWSSSC